MCKYISLICYTITTQLKIVIFLVTYKKNENIKKEKHIFLTYFKTELGFSCTFRADFRVDAHRSPLAARILATSLWMVVNNARDASLQERSDSKMIL